MERRTSTPALFAASPSGELLAERVELNAYRRRRVRLPIVLVCVLLGGFAGYLFTSHERPLYQAVARVRIIFNSQGYGRGRFKIALRDETTTLTSAPFHTLIFHQLDPAARRELAGLGSAHGAPSPAVLMKPEKLARRVEQSGTNAIGKLSVKLVENTSLLEFTFTSPDPALASEVVNTAVGLAQQASFLAYQERFARAKKFFQGKLSSLNEQVQQLQAQVNQVQTGSGPAQLALRQPDSLAGATLTARQKRKRRFRSGTQASSGPDFEFDDDTEDSELEMLAQADNRAHLNTRIAEARLRLLRSLETRNRNAALETGETDFASQDRDAYIALQGRLAAAETTYAGLAETVGDQQPQVLSTLAEIHQIRRELSALDVDAMSTANRSVQLAQRAQGSMDRALSERKAEDDRALQAEINNALLEIDLAVYLAAYVDMQQALQEHVVYAGFRSPTVELVDEAYPPQLSTSQASRFPTAIGCLLGLAVGVFLLALLAYRNRLSWSIARAQQVAGMGLAAILPAAASRHPQQPRSPAEENDHAQALQGLSENVRWVASFQTTQILLFTAATPQEGTSMIAADCASALAASGSRVLLLDANLHRPILSRRLAPRARLGLTHVLTGHATLAQAVQPVASHPGLHLLASGPVPPDASQVLQTVRIGELLDDLRRQYDFVVIDSAPTLLATDSAFLAGYADFVLLVARFGKVDLNLLARAGERFKGSRVRCSGLVVNAVPTT